MHRCNRIRFIIPVSRTNKDVYTRPEKTKNLYTVPSNYFAHDGPKPIPLVTDKTLSAAGKRKTRLTN